MALLPWCRGAVNVSRSLRTRVTAFTAGRVDVEGAEAYPVPIGPVVEVDACGLAWAVTGDPAIGAKPDLLVGTRGDGDVADADDDDAFATDALRPALRVPQEELSSQR